MRRAAVVAFALAASCRPAASPASEAAEILVVAPHPDDETLIAAGVIQSARARGARVAVVVVTNGDFTCARDGHVRQGETVAAMARLGVSEDDVHFLGYPDGWLSDLGDAPLPPLARRAADGSCAKTGGTYAERGAGKRDEHSARTGEPGVYVAASLEGDLLALLERLRPRAVYVTHPLDSHPDHAATYAYLRRALERLSGPPPDGTSARSAAWSMPEVHRAIVHAGPCWPDGRGMTEPCPPVDRARVVTTATPPLPDTYAAYVPGEVRPVPDPAQKLAAIASYRSQLGDDPEHDWLNAFARTDEPFWPDPLVGRAGAAHVFLSPAATEGDAGAYHLSLAAGGDALTLTRGERRLRRWALPLDARERAHEISVAPGPEVAGRAREIAVYRDGALLGVAIEP